MELKHFFGIDFGTTNSATVGITMHTTGNTEKQYGDMKDEPYPSIVAIHKETGEVLSGLEVRVNRQSLSEEYEIITSIKSYLATDHVWEIAGRSWSPIEIASFIFKGLKDNVREKSGIEMKEAMVSVPAGFSSEKRKALREAAALVGIRITGFVSESTAALFYNYEMMKYHRYIGVFDWGGGTLDVSILENKAGLIHEIGMRSLKLGGDDIDLKVAEKIHTKIMNAKGGTIGFANMDSMTKDNLISRAEKVKRDLGNQDKVMILLPKYGDYKIVKTDMDIDVFEALISADIAQAIGCFEEAVADAKLGISELGCILMVGGSSNLRPLIEQVEERWRDKYDIRVIHAQDKGWDVATGAVRLATNPGGFKLNQEVGVMLSDDTFLPILQQGHDIKEHVEKRFALIEDSKTARFIFSDGDKRIGSQDVSTYGFFKEELVCESFIDDDLVLNVEIKSSNKPEGYRECWKYSNLKFCYELPNVTGGNDE